MFEKRKLRRLQADLEALRSTWTLLGEVTVTFEDVATAAISARWSAELTSGERDWIVCYLGLAYVSKMLFNLMDCLEANLLWGEVRSGLVLAPSATLQIVPEISRPRALFHAQVYQYPDGGTPFIQTPTVADGDEEALARHAVGAILGLLRSESPAQAARIEHGLVLLGDLFDEDEYDPGNIESMGRVPYVLIDLLEQEGHLAPSRFHGPL